MKKNNKEVEKLIKLVKKFYTNLENEMEHGEYHAPDVIPYEYENENDYYGKQGKMIDKTAKSWADVENFISEYESTLD